MYQVSEQRFEEMVNAALDKIPDEFVNHMRNVAILIEDYNPEDPEVLGLFEGVSLPERTHHHTGFLPDAIFIYRRALEDSCDSEAHLAHEVEVTVFHELGHFFGFDDVELHRLGWA